MNIFVYGTLLSGEPNNPVLEGLKFDTGFIASYVMTGKDHSFPFVTYGPGVVHGEVYYDVPADVLEDLDWIEGHPHFYRREDVQVHLQSSGTVDAQVYLNQTDATKHAVIKSGDWRNQDG